MKKLLLTMVFCSMLASCQKEEVKCKCDVDVVIVDPVNGADGYYTITNVPSDCNGNVNLEDLDLQENHWYQRTKNCN